MEKHSELPSSTSEGFASLGLAQHGYFTHPMSFAGVRLGREGVHCHVNLTPPRTNVGGPSVNTGVAEM